jgi:hypothetical protein
MSSAVLLRDLMVYFLSCFHLLEFGAVKMSKRNEFVLVLQSTWRYPSQVHMFLHGFSFNGPKENFA